MSRVTVRPLRPDGASALDVQIVYIDGLEVGYTRHGAPDRAAVRALARHARSTGQDLESIMRAVCAQAAKG